MSFWRSLFGNQRTSDAAVLVEALSEHDVSPSERTLLARWLREAAPREIVHLNPRYLAEELGLPVRRTLQLLAPGILTGLFTLNWEARCPWCSYQQPAFDSLRLARATHTCLGCQGTYQAHVDDEIVITFSVNPTVRADGVQDPAWREQIETRYGRLTGHDLLTLQEFRDLFVNEPLPTTESFEVRRMALLFTDLGGSTALYARRGDPRAYSLVREHFLLLQQAVGENDGAVVKTIGDAVMAVFARATNALRAAIESQQAIARFNQERALPAEDALILKAGVHVGPCLLVTLNERLDYFGTTVNAAARVQRLAGPSQIAMTDDLWRTLEEKGPFQPLASHFQTSQEALHGLEGQPFLIHRFGVSEQG